MDKRLKTDVLASCTARAEFYRFLAHVFLHELTEEQIEDMAGEDFPVEDGQMGRGFELMAQYVGQRGPQTRQQLAVDYARLFLGAGNFDKLTAPPYESVYTSEGRLLMQDARDAVLAAYRAEGLDLPAGNVTPEDHVGFELQFMAEVVDRTAVALQAGDLPRFAALALKQQAFFNDHLANWLPAFADDIERHCRTEFYRGVAHLVRGLLAVERPVVDELAGLGCEEAA